MSDTLKLVLTDHWFEEIKSGRKTHEYRKATPFWALRILKAAGVTNLVHFYAEMLDVELKEYPNVEFQKAYRKNPERMTFEIKDIKLVNGLNTDLHIDELVFDIELGDRIDE